MGITRHSTAEGPPALLPTDSQPDPGITEHNRILVEIFLSAHTKEALDSIRARFSAVGIHKVRPRFFRLGHPPENIAIGRAVSAEAARLAIELALQYNDGIGLLVPEERLAHHYIAIGTSIFDTSFQIPISPYDLERLQDPALNTAQFHALYRALAPPVRRFPNSIQR
jgi:hypothetical protein